MRRAALLSLTLHAALAVLVIAGAWLWPGRGVREPVVLAEVELVEQNTSVVGRAAAPAAVPERPSATAATEPLQPSHPSRALPRPTALEAPPPLPSPAAPPVRRTPAPSAEPMQPAEAAASAVTPGRSGSIGTGLVSGSQVIAAALDQGIRNVPPAYPPRAVREGEQGLVVLRIHIAADGSATSVDISRSSGYGLLDRAAQSAIEHWHFVPAREAGVAVPSTMLFKIRFTLTNPEGSQ